MIEPIVTLSHYVSQLATELALWLSSLTSESSSTATSDLSHVVEVRGLSGEPLRILTEISIVVVLIVIVVVLIVVVLRISAPVVIVVVSSGVR